MGREETPSEERANAVIHGVGVLLGLIGLAVLVVQAVTVGREGSLPAVIVYGIALVLLYLFSTLQHAISRARIKRILVSLDHCGIFLLIAGTYTPFCLLMPVDQGRILLVVVWALAAIGMAILAAAYLTRREDLYERVAFALYLAVAWIPIMVASGVVFDALAPPGLVFLIAGGIAYTVGVVFYLWRGLRFSHAVWHLFVVAGSALHFFSVLLYVVPAGA